MFADNGGHMIAARFDGPVELINYFAQNGVQNGSGGEWYNMEDEWAATFQGTQLTRNGQIIIPTGTPQAVRVDIRPHFPSTTGKRPDWFDVTYTYGTNAPIPKTIQNR